MKKIVSIAIAERGTSSPFLSSSLIQEFYLFLTYEQVKLILAVEIEFMIFLIVLPCILISIKLLHQQMRSLLTL